MTLRGVILAGGKGTRLGELTKFTNKHLLPVGPYPMVYYPIKKLAGAGVRDILIVAGPHHAGHFMDLLGSGRDHQCTLTYRVQQEAGGVAEALGLAELFAHDARLLVLMGDNIFYDTLGELVAHASLKPQQAWVMLKQVRDPQRYSVAELKDGTIVGIEEKPKKPKSDFGVAGIYLYPPDVFRIIKKLKLRVQGPLDVSDVNRYYLEHNRLCHAVLRGYWTDAGTPEALAAANQLVAGQPPLFGH
jgi:glucose-1-phosphate thymidylyltransferase